MPKRIEPGTADYNDSVQKFRLMKKCERTMNRQGICRTQRIKAIHKFHEYRNILLARDYCVKTEPAVLDSKPSSTCPLRFHS